MSVLFPDVGQWEQGGGIVTLLSSKPRQRLQYLPEDMQAAMEDVDNGKPVRMAAAEHGIPLRSLYHRLKCRSSQQSQQSDQQSASVDDEGEIT